MADETNPDHGKQDDVRLRLVSSAHAITPLLRTIHTMTGTPVSGLNALDYPLVATCRECGERIRCGNYLADWRHVTSS